MDTIICVENLVRHSWNNCKIIIVDNNSIDDSVIQIEEYLQGKKLEFIRNNYPLWITRQDRIIEANIPSYSVIDNSGLYFDIAVCLDKITLLKSFRNGGFAYGNNLGIKLGLCESSECYFWLLNNDTVVTNNSLKQLKDYFKKDKFGLIGSKILDFAPPHKVQSLFGTFNKYIGNINVHNESSKIDRMAYPIGASLFTSSKIINDVGMFDEDYFLYFEELDYSSRVKKCGYKIGVAEQSIVFHKQGATTNSRKKEKKRALNIEEFKYRGIIKLYSKNHPKYIYAAYFNLALRGVKNLIQFNFRNSFLIFRVIFSNR